MSYMEDPFEGIRPPAMPIEPLRQDNYREWALGMTMVLRQRALAGFIADPAPNLPTDADEATKAKFNARQDAALATIFLGVSNNLRSLLVGVEKPREAWEKLSNTFEPTSRAHIAALKSEFSKIRLQQEETMGMFCSRVDNAVGRLANAGKKVEDTDVAFHLIQDLPSEYDSLVSAIYLWDDNNFTCKNVKAALCAEYGRLQERVKADQLSVPASSSFKAEVQQGGATSYKGRRKSSNGGKLPSLTEMTCFRCQKRGHVSNVCPEPKPVPTLTRASMNVPRRNKQSACQQPLTRPSPTVSPSLQNPGKVYAGFYVAAYIGDADSTSSRLTDFTLDTAATHHIVNDPGLLSHLRELSNGKVQFGTTVAKATAIGVVEAYSGCKTGQRVQLEDVLCVPTLDRNLLSWRALDAEGCSATMGCGIITIFSPTGTEIAKAHLLESFYQMRFLIPRVPKIPEASGREDNVLTASEAPSCQSFHSNANTGDVMLWHDRLGHPNPRCVRQTQQLVSGMIISKGPDVLCQSCIYAKSTRSQHHRIGRVTTTEPLELVHSDLWGPAPTTSYGGARYFITFVDDFSRLTMVYPVANKNEAYSCFTHFRTLAERQTGFKLRRLRTDNGLEYCGGYFSTQLAKLGIVHERTNPYSPQMNGVAERVNRTLLESVRAMLINAHLPPAAWAELVKTAAYLRNRTRHTTTAKIPITAWSGKIPSVRHLRRIGCVAWVHIKPAHRNKLQSRAVYGILLGYAGQTKGYRVWIPEDHKMVETMHITFEEQERGTKRLQEQSVLFPSDPDGNLESIVEMPPRVQETPVSPPPVRPSSVSAPPTVLSPLVSLKPLPPTSPLRVTEDPMVPPYQATIPPTEQKVIASKGEGPAPEGWTKEVVKRPTGTRRDVYFYPPEGRPRLRSARDVQQYFEFRNLPYDKDKFDWTSTLVSPSQEKDNGEAEESIKGASAYCTEIIVPTTFAEAQQSHQREQWNEAIEDELQTMETRHVWKEVAKPSLTRSIGSKWIFTTKKDSKGEVQRFRARLVAQGHHQREGLDYGETYSPVVDFQLVRIFILLLVVLLGWCHAQLDIKCAYLYAPLGEEEIYLRFPLGYAQKSGEATHLLLTKALYGLHQSGRVWNEELDLQLQRRGFVPFRSTKCVYFYQDFAIVLVYVDDLAVFAKTPDHLEEVVDCLESAFDIKRLGPISTFLGVDFSFGGQQVSLQQQNYIEKCVQRFDIPITCKPLIPLAPGNRLTSSTECGEEKSPFPYRELLGCLLFLSQRTRPDIAVSCCILGQFSHLPTRQHWDALIKVLGYCNRTKSLKLTYTADWRNNHMSVFVDADWGSSTTDRHSISGYLVMLCGHLVTWRSIKQRCVALSTMEAEFLAISEAAKEVIWLTRILTECQAMGLQLDKPRIYCDSRAALDYSKNTTENSRSRHIDIRYHFVKELIQSELFELIYIPTKFNLADILTKPLARHRFEELRENFMLNNP